LESHVSQKRLMLARHSPFLVMLQRNLLVTRQPLLSPLHVKKALPNVREGLKECCCSVLGSYSYTIPFCCVKEKPIATVFHRLKHVKKQREEPILPLHNH
jgi:hypothetical protein